jgi:hypothetical protein
VAQLVADLQVPQQVKADPVAVEANAGLDARDHDNRMMNSSGHGTPG